MLIFFYIKDSRILFFLQDSYTNGQKKKKRYHLRQFIRKLYSIESLLSKGKLQ